jgi:hypothetical protein
MLVMCALPLLHLSPGVSSHNGHCLLPLVFYGIFGSHNIITNVWTHALQTRACTPVCHADEQDVAERVHSINVGQQLLQVPYAAYMPDCGLRCSIHCRYLCSTP